MYVRSAHPFGTEEGPRNLQHLSRTVNPSRDVAWSHTMPVTQPRPTPEERVRLGSEAFEHGVRPLLQQGDDGKFVALDVETGDYEIDEEDYAAVSRLRARKPAAEARLTRIGQPAAYRLRPLA
jgi:hypothetical protein